MINQADVTAALQALATQQSAMVAAQTEALRLQRLLVEHLLNQQGQLGQVPAGDSLAAPDASQRAEVAGSLTIAAEQSQPEESAQPPSPLAQATADSANSEPQGSDVAGPAVSSAVSARSVGATPRGARGRAARYFQVHPVLTSRTISHRELSLLGGLVDLGNAGRLVLQFGPHRGATLGQVAQVDPAYVRTLALRAQRANVRAAARQLLAVFERVDAGPKSAKKSAGPRR